MDKSVIILWRTKNFFDKFSHSNDYMANDYSKSFVVFSLWFSLLAMSSIFTRILRFLVLKLVFDVVVNKNVTAFCLYQLIIQYWLIFEICKTSYIKGNRFSLPPSKCD